VRQRGKAPPFVAYWPHKADWQLKEAMLSFDDPHLFGISLVAANQ